MLVSRSIAAEVFRSIAADDAAGTTNDYATGRTAASIWNGLY